MPVNTSITLRKGSSSQWSTTNPVLASGEPGYDLTNNILKIGDGVSAWNSLSNHSHSSSDITNFNSSVSGLLPVTNIIAGNNITVSNNAGSFTINSTAAGGASISNSGLNRLLTSDGSTSGIVGQANMTFNGSLLNVSGSGNFTSGVFVSGVPLGEVIDDEVAGLLVAGSGINLTYNDSANTLTVDTNVSTSLIAGSGISLNYNISTDELSIGLSSPIFVSGNNFGIGTSSPSSALDINSDSLRIRTSRTPASAAASGNAGDICWDANYLYVCVATNTWKRSAITTW